MQRLCFSEVRVELTDGLPKLWCLPSGVASTWHLLAARVAHQMLREVLGRRSQR